MRFGRSRNSISYLERAALTPDAAAAFDESGGRTRSRRGAPMASPGLPTTDPLTGLERNPRTGLSTESSWRSFFGPKPSPTGIARPVPDVKNPALTNPGAMIADTHPGWAESARQRQSFSNPFVNQLANGDLADSPANPTILSQPDPAAAVTPPTSTPDLSTPAGLMADANNTTQQFFNRRSLPIPAPAPGQVQSGTSLLTKYGSAFVRNANDPFSDTASL